MVGKLFKYEFTSLWKPVAWGFLVELALALLVNLSMSFIKNDTFQVLIVVVLVFFAFGICLVSFVVCLKQFYSSCYGQQGYLTFTLPVHPWQILLSRLLSSFVLVFITVAVQFLALLIAVPFSLWTEMFGDIAFWSALGEFLQSMSATDWVDIILTILHALLMGLLYTMLFLEFIFLGISIGQLFNNFRVPITFVACFVISAVNNALIILLSTLVEFLNIDPDSLLAFDSLFRYFNLSVLYSNLYALGVGALVFFGIVWIMNNRLNVE